MPEDQIIETTRPDGSTSAKLGLVDGQPYAGFFYSNGRRWLTVMPDGDGNLTAFTFHPNGGDDGHTINVQPDGKVIIIITPRSPQSEIQKSWPSEN